MTTRKGLVEALRVRCGGAEVGEQIKAFDELMCLTADHRKSAIQVLRVKVTKASAAPTRNRLHAEVVRPALTMFSMASAKTGISAFSRRSQPRSAASQNDLGEDWPRVASAGDGARLNTSSDGRAHSLAALALPVDVQARGSGCVVDGRCADLQHVAPGCWVHVEMTVTRHRRARWRPEDG